MGNLQRHAVSASHQLLGHILERPELVAAVRELPAGTLSRLIDRVGLEDCGELVALASTEQLQAMFDEDLWRSDAPGDEERFDPQRFALWLEIMGEAGSEFLVQRLVELPLDLLTLAVHRAVLVIDMDALASHLAGARDEAGEIEQALEGATTEEWEEFCLIARDPNVWELIWDALLSLDRDHHERLRAILEHCCAMSTEFINGQGGLYEVLTADEMLESDARADRDDRRASGGYVTPGDARGFLALAGSDEQTLVARDAITAAYFRALEGNGKSAPVLPRLSAAAGGGNVQELMQLIAQSEQASEPPARALPRSASGGKSQPAAAKAPKKKAARGKTQHAPVPEVAQPAQDKTAFARALAALSVADPQTHTARMEELGYLANVLLSGCTHQGRRLRPVEALEAAVATTSLGLELWRGSEDAKQLVTSVSCDRMFRSAWQVLQRDLVQPARQKLEQAVALHDSALAKQARTDEAFGLGGLCEHGDLGLSETAFAALLALAEPLPWLHDKKDGHVWIDTRAAFLLARRRVTEPKSPPA